MPHPWAAGPVWTTVAVMKTAFTQLNETALSRVSIIQPEPPDLQVAADEFIAEHIVRAQGVLVGYLEKVVDGPDKIATTYEETPVDLRKYTSDQALVELHSADKRARPDWLEALAEGVKEWRENLAEGRVFIATVDVDDEAAPRSTPPRRTKAPASAARSPLASRAQELLGW